MPLGVAVTVEFTGSLSPASALTESDNAAQMWSRMRAARFEDVTDRAREWATTKPRLAFNRELEAWYNASGKDEENVGQDVQASA